jgi:hypothetical protein
MLNQLWKLIRWGKRGVLWIWSCFQYQPYDIWGQSKWLMCMVITRLLVLDTSILIVKAWNLDWILDAVAYMFIYPHSQTTAEWMENLWTVTCLSVCLDPRPSTSRATACNFLAAVLMWTWIERLRVEHHIHSCTYYRPRQPGKAKYCMHTTPAYSQTWKQMYSFVISRRLEAGREIHIQRYPNPNPVLHNHSEGVFVYSPLSML